MSKIANDGLTQSGTGCFIAVLVLYGNSGLKGLRRSLHVSFVVSLCLCTPNHTTNFCAISDLKFRIKRKNELNSVPLQWTSYAAYASQRQPAVYNFHTSWCQCNSAGPMTRDNGPCVQFREAVLKPSDTVTGVRALEGYRCSVDNATPARLTSSCGWWLISPSPSPSPTVTYYRHRVNLLRLRTRLTRAQDASSWLHLSMIVKLVKRSSVRSSCLKFSTVRTEK